MRIWDVLKDILLTGAGIILIMSQMLSPRPSDALIVAGLALTSPSLADHAKAVLSGNQKGHPGSTTPDSGTQSESSASSSSSGL